MIRPRTVWVYKGKILMVLGTRGYRGAGGGLDNRAGARPAALERKPLSQFDLFRSAPRWSVERKHPAKAAWAMMCTGMAYIRGVRGSRGSK